MQIDLEQAESARHEVLRQLMQLYAYDFSEIVGLDVGQDGRFPGRALEPAWDDPRRSAFFLRVDGRLAGFAVVRHGSRLSGDPDVWDMEEFFVMRRSRRAGVGAEAARRIFEAHRGKWEVRERRENVAAVAFWRRAIGAYTGGLFTESDLDDERWWAPVQSFTS